SQRAAPPRRNRDDHCVSDRYASLTGRGQLRREVPVTPSIGLNRTDAASDLSPSGPHRALKQFGLVLLCGLWIALGLFGHDPWKPDDALSFGIAYDMLTRGDWVVPQLAGTPVPERAPLFYVVAAACAKVFGGVLLQLHEAARLAVAICLALTLWLLSLTARELYGRAFRWLPVLLFIGCVGLWDRGHSLSPELGLLVADAL